VNHGDSRNRKSSGIAHCNGAAAPQYALVLWRASVSALINGTEKMNLIKSLFKRGDARAEVRQLYAAIVAEARAPGWYLHAGVADSIDGRFAMMTAMLALVLNHMESLGDEAKAAAALLTEAFVEDMDGQLRELGVGDVVVGKHIGKMMGALGGQLGAYRAVFAHEEALEAALLRNLYRGNPPPLEAISYAASAIRARHEQFSQATLAELMAGRLAHA
jgi:cytochrome b pre-mRNA-processing protein 3